MGSHLARRRFDPEKFPSAIRQDLINAHRFWEQRRSMPLFGHGLELVEEGLSRNVFKANDKVDSLDRTAILLSLYHALTKTAELPFNLAREIGDEHKAFCALRKLQEDPEGIRDKDKEKNTNVYMQMIAELLRRLRISTVVRVLDNAVSAKANMEEWAALRESRGPLESDIATNVQIPVTQKRLARSMLEIDVPLSEGFGFHGLTEPLRAFAVSRLYPDHYVAIEKRLKDPDDLGNKIRATMEALARLFEILRQHAAIPAPIREKTAASCFRKITERYGFDLEHVVALVSEISDLLAGMFAVSTLQNAHRLLGITIPIIYASFPNARLAIDDYFAHPKESGYTGLHIDVYPNLPELAPFEIQIHTAESWWLYHKGGAAHYLFKAPDDPRIRGGLARYQRFVSDLANRRN